MQHGTLVIKVYNKLYKYIIYNKLKCYRLFPYVKKVLNMHMYITSRTHMLISWKGAHVRPCPGIHMLSYYIKDIQLNFHCN